MTPLNDTLCLQCGLCCNGALFADVRPEAGDRSPLFAGCDRVNQPCPAFNTEDCTCAIYPDRPARCRKFECHQLLGVRKGGVSVAAALKTIRTARRRAAEVEKLLHALGFGGTKSALKARFKHCQRAAETGRLAPEQFERLADLQQAMHRLTMLLAKDFYPD